MEKTCIKTEFMIFSDDVNPIYITEKLGIRPTQSWAKGDDIKGKSLKRKDSLWLLSTDYQESLDINESLDSLVSVLKNKTRELKELKTIYPVDYTVEIVVKVRNKEAPAIYFEKGRIQFFSDIQAAIDIDLYV